MKISPYAVGALLYAPANQENLARRVIQGQMDAPYSLALCLEDSISDCAVPEAEARAVQTLDEIARADEDVYRPLLFIRVRHPDQIPALWTRLGAGREILTGFIAPKFTQTNGPAYLAAVRQISEQSGRPVYLMPTLESSDLAEPDLRPECLRRLKTLLDANRDLVLNVRVGGNDFCNVFGVRRARHQTIYEIGCVERILTDILSCFSRDYVVSGPVWEYFDAPEGLNGLARELERDLLAGFVGKTVIHPNQIVVVQNGLRVSKADADDARRILGMADNDRVLVEKSADGGRMNEYKTHTRWARKICALAAIYGVKP